MFAPLFGAVALVTALFGLVLSLFMLLPMAVDLIDGNSDWQTFAGSAAVVGTICLLAAITNWGRPIPTTRRFGFLMVNSLWFFSALIAALPYIFTKGGYSLADAYFESVSGLTTTGGTVFSGLDQMPRGILLWRSLTQWLGGIGIIGMGLLLFPFLKVGGMQIYKLESSQQSENPVAHFSTFALDIALLYLVLTVACVMGYAFAGMGLFDAVNHAMTTISTGGFSTHDRSMDYFGRGVHLVAIVFMIAGSLPFAALLRALLTRDVRNAADPQIPWFLSICAAGAVLVFISARINTDLPVDELLIDSVFNVVSIMSTTGYATHDYLAWGSLSIGVFLIATFLGGPTGSTAGGIKTYRLVLVWHQLRLMLKELVYPNGVFVVRYDRKHVPDRVLRAVSMFLTIYFGVLLASTLAMTSMGLDFETAFAAAQACLTNVGPGIVDLVGPVGNFGSLPEGAKWILSFVMILGRLEIMTVLVLFSPMMWSR